MEEKQKLTRLARGADKARENWVRQHYMPQGARLPRLLQDHDYKDNPGPAGAAPPSAK